MRVSMRLKELGLTQQWIRDWEKAVSEMAKKTARKAVAPNADESDWCPYEAENGYTYHLTKHFVEGGEEISRSIVAHFEARISQEAISENGQRWYTIEGKTFEGAQFVVEIKAEDFADDRALQAVLTGLPAPVRPCALAWPGT